MAKKIALLIGVSEYGEGIPPLSAPLNDVEAMQQVLQNPKLGDFDRVEPLSNPGLIEMRKAIVKLFKEADNKDDLVLLYFSGHGLYNQDNEDHLYLANRISANDDFEATAVEANFIQVRLNLCRAKRRVVILDACFSGAYANCWEAKGDSVVNIKQQLEQQLGAKGSVVLTSSSATEKSFENKDSKLSLYTKHLVNGIRSGAADKDNDGNIFIYELHDYAKEKVKEENDKMTPNIIVNEEGYKIIIAKALIKFDAEVVRNKPSELERLINIHFPPDELNEVLYICSDISYEEFPGKNREEKVKALIVKLQEENYTQTFIEEMKKQKPDVFL
ncbi:caspase family protein [Nostoc punctiforme FACHB-252]|uniref:Caspase family protein n=1 Tax=Nostoc punctiforme FACHB-252 TaxID=1357509 RepID=A0ABR8H977_NOSPU|nr:caspase family protein [Nostoc punctiforme]MBD2611963.1 caspase family protein [Nostoc punctiforme FACHB-252]